SHGVSAGPIQMIASALAISRAEEGRRARPCGEAPGGTISCGAPTPCITRDTIECTGWTSVATWGAAATGPVRAARATAAGRRRCSIHGLVGRGQCCGAGAEWLD